MNIHTEFDQGEEVFIPVVNAVLTEKIEKIHITVSLTDKVRANVVYDMYEKNEGEKLTGVKEENMFKTRKAAARRVMRDMGFYVSEEDMKDVRDQYGY
jgi:hypothetical protein